MRLWDRILGRKSVTAKESWDRDAFLEEIAQAKKEWVNASNKLDHVVDKDQIDYAIFAMEAAEKRYNMLLRKAKEMKLQLRTDEWNAENIVTQFGSREEQQA